MRKIKVGDKVQSLNETDKYRKKVMGKVVNIQKGMWPIEVQLDNTLDSGLYYENELEIIDEDK